MNKLLLLVAETAKIFAARHLTTNFKLHPLPPDLSGKGFFSQAFRQRHNLLGQINLVCVVVALLLLCDLLSHSIKQYDAR